MENKKEQIEKATVNIVANIGSLSADNLKLIISKFGLSPRYYLESFMALPALDLISCWEDIKLLLIQQTALSQPKEEPKKDVEPQAEITSAELWKNRYESLLRGLNDLTTELHVYKLNKDFDLDELKKRFELAFNFDYDCSFNNLWNFFLPHLQKPVESDVNKSREMYVNHFGSQVNFSGEYGDFTPKLLHEIFDYFNLKTGANEQ